LNYEFFVKKWFPTFPLSGFLSAKNGASQAGHLPPVGCSLIIHLKTGISGFPDFLFSGSFGNSADPSPTNPFRAFFALSRVSGFQGFLFQGFLISGFLGLRQPRFHCFGRDGRCELRVPPATLDPERPCASCPKTRFRGSLYTLYHETGISGSGWGLGMTVITVAQVKGGSGKTTAAMCTVAELVARGRSVAALDLDPNRPLGEFFQRVPDLQHVEVVVPTGERRVSALVRELATRNDDVVIDLMGAATNDTQVAMALADLVIIPSQMSGTDLKCGVETWRQAVEAAEISNRTIARGVLLARTSAGALRPRVESFLREQYKRVGAHVMATAFGDRAAWKEMTYSAHIPHLHDRDSNAAKNFISVFEEMMELIRSAPAAVAAA
jgi:chromosome partitioning protein